MLRSFYLNELELALKQLERQGGMVIETFTDIAADIAERLTQTGPPIAVPPFILLLSPRLMPMRG